MERKGESNKGVRELSHLVSLTLSHQTDKGLTETRVKNGNTHTHTQATDCMTFALTLCQTSNVCVWCEEASLFSHSTSLYRVKTTLTRYSDDDLVRHTHTLALTQGVITFTFAKDRNCLVAV